MGKLTYCELMIRICKLTVCLYDFNLIAKSVVLRLLLLYTKYKTISDNKLQEDEHDLNTFSTTFLKFVNLLCCTVQYCETSQYVLRVVIASVEKRNVQI